MREKLGILKKSEFFQGLNEESLIKVSEISYSKAIEKDEFLFMEGEEVWGMFVVIQGELKALKYSPMGKKRLIIRVFQPYDGLAEAMLFEKTYAVSVQATIYSKVLVIPRDAFLKILYEDRELSLGMIRNLSKRNRYLVSKLEDCVLKEVSQRLAVFLMEQKQERKKERLCLDLSKQDLAAVIGTVPETLSRTFRKLEIQGIIKVEDNIVTILDENQLRLLSRGEPLCMG